MTEPEDADRPRTTAVRLDVDGPIARFTLDRPAKLNALDRAMLEELATAAHWLDQRPDIKVVVVSGTGRSFCAGFDLADRRWEELGPPERSAEVGRAMAEAVGTMRAVTIASVRGHCIGGGVVLASACDLRIASDTASFAIPEVDLGIPLYWTGIPRLVRELGPALTKELVLTGRAFGAAEAHSMRFVNRVVPDDDLDAEVSALARTLGGKAGVVLDVTKRQVEAAAPVVADASPAEDVAHFAAARADPDGQASARAYLARLAERR